MGNNREENTSHVTVQVSPAPAAGGELWCRYLRFARRLQRTGELGDYDAELQNDHCPEVDRELMRAAIRLVRDPIAAALKPAAPTVEQLSDLVGWLAQVVAENDAARRRKRWARESRGAGRPRDGSGCGASVSPVFKQKSKHGLEELARRLENVIARHQAAGREFRREMLDQRSPHYVPDRDGGIDTKGIVFLANLITGRAEQRSYDRNWEIVSEFMRRREPTDSTAKSTPAPRRSRP